MADDIFEREIRPFLFDGLAEGDLHPEFVQLVGQTGAGRSRALGRLLEGLSGRAAVLRAADLTPFLHDSPGTDAIRAWISASLNYAREHRISVILEDSFPSGRETAAAIRVFERAGFATRVVVAAVSEAESLLAVAARAQRQRRDNRGPMTPAVADGLELSRAILANTPRASSAVVVTRDGAMTEPLPGHAATAQWSAALAAPLPPRAAAEWISELRRLAESVLATDARGHNGTIRDLIELHRLALTTVTPTLPLPQDSTARRQLDARIRRDLVELEARNHPLETRGRAPTSEPTGIQLDPSP